MRSGCIRRWPTGRQQRSTRRGRPPGRGSVDAPSRTCRPLPTLTYFELRAVLTMGTTIAAHELGHCILHRHIPADYWSTEAKVRLREAQAHKFASAFLLPRDTFSDDVQIPSLETSMALKP